MRPLGTVAIANSVFIGNHAVQGGAIAPTPLVPSTCRTPSALATKPTDRRAVSVGGVRANKHRSGPLHVRGQPERRRRRACCRRSQGPLKMYNSIIDQNYAYNGTGLFADVIGNRDASSAVLSIIRGNLFREYNENVETSPDYTGIGLNAEAVPASPISSARRAALPMTTRRSAPGPTPSVGRSRSTSRNRLTVSALRDLADLDGTAT